MKKILIISLLISIVAASFFSGCMEEAGTMGTLRLQITDRPGDLDILYANVTISNITVHKSGAETENGDEDQEYDNIDDFDDGFIADGDGPYFGEIDEDIDFKGNASGGTKPYNYSWNFGDGNSSYGQNVTHNYSANGTYEVNLTVVDNESDSRVDWYITFAIIGEIDEDDDNSTAGWYTIVNESQTFDLIALQNHNQRG